MFLAAAKQCRARFSIRLTTPVLSCISPSPSLRMSTSTTDTTSNTNDDDESNDASASSIPQTFESRLERGPIPKAELPFHHFHKKNGNSPPFVKPPKFESPRKRANKMMRTVVREAIGKSKASNPAVHDTHFRVGDAIELKVVQEGGVDSAQTEKIRGVVLGRTNRGLGSGVYLRDVVMGEPINRKIPLYSPMVKEIHLLEKNFVFKGRRKVKRAKLYYLRDRLPQETRVTKLKK